jgi:hypothetical protein
LKALPHEFAAFRSVEMLMIRSRRPHKLAHLLKSCFGKPSLAPAALDCNAIGLDFIFALGLMRAPMVENPQFDRSCQASEQLWIKVMREFNGRDLELPEPSEGQRVRLI